MAGLDFLRGLFGSSARDYVASQPNDMMVRAAPDSVADRQIGAGTVLRRPPTLTPDPQAARDESARKMALFGATLSDVGSALRGGQGDALARVQAGFRQRAEEEAALRQREQMQALAQQLYGNDPEAQLLFMADPGAFVGARAERLKPRVMSGGQTFIDPATGERYSAPLVAKMDDRMAFYDPNTGEATYSDPRGPTFQEQTGRMSAEESGRHNRVSEEVARGQLGVAQGSLGVRRQEFEERKRQGGFGTPGFGGAGGWEEF